MGRTKRAARLFAVSVGAASGDGALATLSGASAAIGAGEVAAVFAVVDFGRDRTFVFPPSSVA
jgi:hypothetical protein